MIDTDTGGQAFPMRKYNPNVMQFEEVCGMTLRDYFAAKAMNALILEVADWKYMPNEIANFAYKQADAMIRAREAK